MISSRPNLLGTCPSRTTQRLFSVSRGRRALWGVARLVWAWWRRWRVPLLFEARLCFEEAPDAARRAAAPAPFHCAAKSFALRKSRASFLRAAGRLALVDTRPMCTATASIPSESSALTTCSSQCETACPPQARASAPAPTPAPAPAPAPTRAPLKYHGTHVALR